MLNWDITLNCVCTPIEESIAIEDSTNSGVNPALVGGAVGGGIGAMVMLVIILSIAIIIVILLKKRRKSG